MSEQIFPKTIWSNIDLDLRDWEDDIRENYPDLPHEEYEDMMYQLNNDYLEDERLNLDVHVGEILTIADLGLWNGRHQGYHRGHNMSLGDCLYPFCGDYAEWYVTEDGKFCSRQIHHDGTNYYRFRTFKKDATEEAIDNLLGLIFDGKATEDDIDRVTVKLGKMVADVYGWKLPEK